MAVQRCRLELRQQEDAIDLTIETIADRNIDQPVLAGERHRGLAALAGERMEPRAASTTHDDCESFFSAFFHDGN
jgi:hypothetical protein